MFAHTPELIAHAVRRLRAGGLVAFPTETVYGLGADALNPAAVARVFAIKGRPSRNPLIVHVSSTAMAQRLVSSWPAAAEALAKTFWPGPLSIILPRSSVVPDAVAAGGPTVALRCPDHPLTLALIEAFGGPIVGPSANPSGRVSPTTAAHVRASFSADDVSVLDGGPCRGGIESTVVTLAGPVPRILRPGLISPDELSAALGAEVQEESAAAAHGPGMNGSAPLPSPGMLPAHYAPRAPARLIAPGEVVPELWSSREMIVVLACENLAAPPPHVVVLLPPDARGFAARLYAAMREADELGAEQILIALPAESADPRAPDASVWRAVLDRLGRATAQRPDRATPDD